MPETETKEIEEVEEEDSEYTPLPWEVYYSSTPGHIICDESSEGTINLMMAFVFFIAAYFIIDSMPFSDSSVDDVFVYAVRSICPAIGGFCLLLGIRAKWRMKKFGTSTFIIKDLSGFLGGTLKGSIQSSVDLRPTGDYSISLECVKKTVSSSGEKSSSKLTTLWKDSKAASPHTVSSRAGIPVEFSIPDTLPEGNLLDGDGQIHWTLRIYAPLPGLNYKAAFIVPVFNLRRKKLLNL